MLFHVTAYSKPVNVLCQLALHGGHMHQYMGCGDVIIATMFTALRRHVGLESIVIAWGFYLQLSTAYVYGLFMTEL